MATLWVGEDLPRLLALYTQLNGNSMPAIDDGVKSVWTDIMEDPHHHIIGGFLGDVLISSCVIVIIPNLTHGQRPYALVENVITDAVHRGKGHATAILNFARGLAKDAGCYKIMLLTGSKKEATLTFYERAGYNRQDKTAFIQWL